MNQSVLFALLVCLIVAVFASSSSNSVSAMSPIDAFQEAKAHHKRIGDANFHWEEYNVMNEHITIKPQMRGAWGNPQPPHYEDDKMPHSKGSEIGGPRGFY